MFGIRRWKVGVTLQEFILGKLILEITAALQRYTQVTIVSRKSDVFCV